MRRTLGMLVLPMLLGACGSAASDPSTQPPLPEQPDGGNVPDAAPRVPLPGPCQAIDIEAGKSVGGYVSDMVSFYDAGCQLRTAALVRNDARDPGGSFGGMLRAFSYAHGSDRRTVLGTGANGLWHGFGYVIAHYGPGGDDAESRDTAGTYRTVLAGLHHAIHAFTWRIYPSGKPVDVTVHWFFATGRSYPVYAITYDASPAGTNAVAADTRAPYGDMAFEGSPDGDVEGVGWGDKFKFRTTSAGAVTPQSTWDYTQPNHVPYALAWSASKDAEMGLVQTESWESHPAGGDYGGGLLGVACWGKTSATRGARCSSAGWTMPDAGLWPFQLNNWELPFTTSSHRLAWGATYGAVGQTDYDTFGKTSHGYPFTSYATTVVMGGHAESAVAAQLKDAESTSRATLTAARGTVALRGPGGVGRTDTVAFALPGYSPVYGTWDVDAEGNAADVTLTSEGLDHPILRLRKYTATSAPARVEVNGQLLVPHVDYFATVDAPSSALWITLARTVSGATRIVVM
jgi:hypothetical protein